MSVYILGVDPGFTGALAFYDASSRKLDAVFDMPLKVDSKALGGTERNSIDLASLAALVDPYAKDTLLAVIEDVAARPGQGVSSMFRFGYGAGAVAGVVAANLIPIHFTPPSVWKGLMGLSHDKKKSLELAVKSFPEQASGFKRMKDNGRAEAALLAKFGERLLPLVQRRVRVGEV